MKFSKLLIAAATLTIAAGSAQAQDAVSLDQLLRQVQQGTTSDNRANREREQAFVRQKSEQQRLLNQARSERTALERRGEQLEALFESNNGKIATATEELNERLGSLKELFGVLQQVSGDTQGVFQNSLTNIEYPDRQRFLIDLGTKMASTTSLASIEDIEQLWFELQREMTETGKVVKFSTDVINTEGERAPRDIVRVGAFNVLSDGKYLKYDSETGLVSELPRQPPAARYAASTGALYNAADGDTTKFGLDPTRGGILAQLVDAPTIRERIDQGGIVGYCIIGLGILGLLIAAFLMISLTGASSKVSSQLKDTTRPNKNNPLGRVLATYDANKAVDTETVELKLSEAVLKETPALTRGLLFLKVIAALLIVLVALVVLAGARPMTASALLWPLLERYALRD
ncbi:MAG: energy transducer TonB, partial [Pseudomonadota bacterium]